MPVIVAEFWRFLRATAAAVADPLNKAGNAAQTAMAVVGIVGTPAFVTVVAEQMSDTIARLTGLHIWLVPWVACGLTFVVIAFFLAWRAQMLRVREFEDRFAARVAPHFYKAKTHLSLELRNTSATEIKNCEVRLLTTIDAETGTRYTEALAFPEIGHRRTLFDIPPHGVVSLTLLSQLAGTENDAFGDTRFITPGTPMAYVPFKKGSISIQIQASNIIPMKIEFDYDKSSQEVTNEPS
jgi:hypothetical protein